ncbi:flagellar hook-length control protein FliK [Pseudomonas oligotrophica]|uniref:flagellar hook-length control protein FliK n=1 Tax=Pseudomonas oligotrophica TaxID=2912055 RepID=UPI001F260288|nr:flagellar hook-length control protein FliK [Pseudomonas oligotrophica]MCF7202782.1 flagellar hook-length control protein FliK [Pseudomonas oligotrophica]
MTEIKSVPALAPTAATRGSTAAVDLALRLLQPMQGLLAAGETAQAEVISVREAVQSFQLVLRLTQDNGRQTTLEASSPKPVLPGASYAVAALSDSRLMAHLQPGRAQPLQSLDLDLLPAGTLLQGKVVGSGQTTDASGRPSFQIALKLLNSPLSGQTLLIESSKPLALGSLLSAQVQGGQALAFVPLTGLLDQLQLSRQLASQQGRQASLEGVFRLLQGLGGNLPESLRAPAAQLLGLVPEVAQLGDAKALAQAIAASGAFLEARLLAGQVGSPPADIKAQLLRLLAQLPSQPGATTQLAAQASAGLGQALPAFARQALGALGQASAQQLALAFPLGARLPPGMDGEADLETLLKLAAAAVSRLQTHQLASLAQSQQLPDGNQLTTWQLELPMRDRQDIIPLQIKLQRETAQRDSGKEQAEPIWRVDLAFDLAPLGPLQVQAQLQRGSLSSQLWAEREATARLISAELANLRDRLLAAGLQVGKLDCRQGMPPQGPRTSLEQRFVDETA